MTSSNMEVERSSTEYKSVIRAFIVEEFLFGDDSELTDDMSLFENGIVDSTGILELINFLEERYAIKVDDDELSPENFDSLAKITAYVSKKVV